MQVKLRVIGGKNDGREIKISVPEFLIGRGEEAHLRPSSDLISRKHCSLRIENGSVTIADHGSRNGTFVNGKQITGPYVAKVGDKLRVGRLQFELLIDHVQPGNKKPKVQGVAEAAARAASNMSGSELDEESITDWLSQPVDDESSQSLHDTKYFTLDETPTKLFMRSDEISESISDTLAEESDTDPGSKKSKKKPMKLPVKNNKAESSKIAADEVLRKFFNRR